MNTAYTIKIGNTIFYHHAACMDEAERRNVNNLAPEQLQKDRKALREVPEGEIPDDAVCSYPGCWKPIKE